MPSVAVVSAAPTIAAAPSPTGASASGTASSSKSNSNAKASPETDAPSSADFGQEVKTALGDTASPTSATPDTSTNSTRDGGNQPTTQSGQATAIDQDTLAALIAAAGAEGGATDVDPAASIDDLLAKLGLKLDANGNVVLAEGDGADTETGSTDGDDATSDAATDLAAALAALATLLGQPAPKPTTTTVPSEQTTTEAAPVTTPAPVKPGLPVAAEPLGDDMAPAVVSNPADDDAERAAAAAAAAAAAMTQAGQTTNTEATDTAPRPVARGPVVSTRAEERQRRIAAEVAAITGGTTPDGTYEIRGGASATATTATTATTAVADGAASKAPSTTLGDLLAIAERGDGEAPTVKTRSGDVLTAFTPPTAPVQDPMLAAATTASASVATTPSAASTAPASQATIDALAQTVAAHAARQDSRFEIKLNPHELGKVDVSLNISSDGTVTAHLRVERAETLDMMMRDQSHLARALEQSGLSVGSGGLEFSLQQQAQGWDRDANSDGRANVGDGDSADEGVAAEAVAATRRYSRAGPAGVDLRV